LKHLRVVLSLSVLLIGIAGAAIYTADAGAPVGGNAVTPRSYLPLVARGESAPAPGTWITVLEEGFENAPGSLWSFFDYNGTTSGEYYWADRTCHSLTGSRSAWAVGGGSDGAALSCNSDYPDNADSWMKYGPFSLADAQMAEMRFNYYLRDLAAGDAFCWGASEDGVNFPALCLDTAPGVWTSFVLHLDNLFDDQPPSVSFLGKPQVWVAFRFASDATGHASPGPFVDDVLIRKCPDTLCE
jgi:hypothetical protein